MSHSAGKNQTPPSKKAPLNTFSDELRQALKSDEVLNKPDFREHDLDRRVTNSPISPLHKQQTTASTSSSSGGSNVTVSRTPHNNVPKSRTHSGEISGSSSESSPRPRVTARKATFQGRDGKSDSVTVNVPKSRTGISHSGEMSGSSSESSHRPSVTPRKGIFPGRDGKSDSVTSQAVNVLPAGNIIPSGRIVKTGMASKSARSDVLGSGTGNYGHGNIMRGGGRGRGGGDAEEYNKAGNEQYRKGNYVEALRLFDKAVSIDRGNAAYRSNRAAVYAALGRLGEGVRDYEEAVRLDPNYWRAHHRLGSLFVRLGQVECARRHLFIPGHQPDFAEMQKLESVEKHLSRSADARRVGDWNGALREISAAVAAGADWCPQLYMFKTETLLKLNELEDAESILVMVPRLEPYPKSCSQTRFFAMLSEAYLYFVRAQIEMALGRFDNAVTAAEKAGQIDPRNADIVMLNKNVKMVTRARTRGNDLFKSERFTEACAAYDEGLRLDPSNSVLYCNRAACFFKLGQWEQSINDSSRALRIQPNYMKALGRRAACNSKLERWEDAVSDYEILRRECPGDNEIAEALFHAQVALKKSRGEEVYNMKFGGDVEEVSSLDQFKATISIHGVSVVFFKTASEMQCKRISPFVDTLCGRYPSVNFLKVDIEKSPTVADNENVRIVPTFKIYKNGSRVTEIVCPSLDMLEHSVRHYSI